MSRPFDDRGVVGEVGGVVEFIGTTEQFRVEDLRRCTIRSVLRSIGCDPSGVSCRRESTASTTGIAVPWAAAHSTAFKIRSDDTKGRTPSWTAISATGSGQSGQAVAYRVEPLRPARRAGVLGYVETGCQILPEIDLSSGRTTTICVLCSVLAKAFIAWPNTGSDPSMRNCLGSGPPRRLPLPPAR